MSRNDPPSTSTPATGSETATADFDPDGADFDDSVLVDACADLVDGFLEERLDALFARAREQFFSSARDAENAEEEARQMALLEELDALESPVCAAFESALRVRLARLSLGEVVLPTIETPDADGEGPDHMLELVATRKLDDWVRFTSIIRRHHSSAGSTQHALETHLTRLAGTTIDGDSNPLGVIGVCALFHDATAGMGLSRDMRTVIFKAFETQLVEHLEELMGAIVARLEQPADVAPQEATAEESAGGSDTADSGSDTDTDQAKEQATGGHAASDPSENAPPVEAINAERLQALLTRLRRDARSAGLRDPDDFQAAQAWLRASVPSAANADETPDETTADTLGTLLATVLSDPGVPDSVRIRVSRLALPMLQLASRDDDHVEMEADAARHDPVTGLQDRTAFMDRLERTLSSSEARSTAVCLIGVDGLDVVRRRAGAQVAGRVVRLLAGQLVKHAGSSATTARIADDSLAVMLEGFGQGWAKRFSQRLLRALRQNSFRHAGKKLDVRVSIGISATKGSSGKPSTLVERANAARNEASAAGGNRVCVAKRPRR